MRDRVIREEEDPVDCSAYSTAELREVLSHPHRAVEVVLAERGRLAATLTDRRSLGLLVLLLFAASILFALPFGAVLSPDRLWRVVLLFAGSALICFPSLHVFGAFLGFKVDIGQNLALTLVSTSVAALFSLGFFPILWFLKVVMADQASADVLHGISVGLLVVAFGAGLAHVLRCLGDPATGRPLGVGFPVVVGIWQCLLIFITYRMAVFLELV
jgi:hypothetical protein